MKALHFFLILLFSIINVAHASAQFKVVFVDGTVKRPNGQAIKVDDVVDQGDWKRFTYEGNSSAAVYNPQHGRIVLPEVNASTDRSSNYGSKVSDGLVTRNALRDFIRFRLNNGNYLMLQKDKFAIDLYFEHETMRKELEQVEEVFVRYSYNGDVLKSKLQFNEGVDPDEWDYKLYIDKNKMFTDKSGKPISEAKVYGVPEVFMTVKKEDGSTKEQFLGILAPRFIEDDSKIKEEVGQVMNFMQRARLDMMRRKALETHFQQNYLSERYFNDREMMMHDLKILAAQLSKASPDASESDPVSYEKVFAAYLKPLYFHYEQYKSEEELEAEKEKIAQEAKRLKNVYMSVKPDPTADEAQMMYEMVEAHLTSAHAQPVEADLKAWLKANFKEDFKSL